MDVELHLGSGVSRHIQDSGVHADCVLGAYLYAVAAVDAYPQVDVEADGVLLDIGIRVLAGHNGDASGWADGLAEHATHAARRPFLPDGELVTAAESRLECPGLFGVLRGDGSCEVLEQAQTVRRMKPKVPDKVCGGDLQAAHDLRNVELFPERQLAPANHLDCHQDLP